jgi:gluconolactonase
MIAMYDPNLPDDAAPRLRSMASGRITALLPVWCVLSLNCNPSPARAASDAAVLTLHPYAATILAPDAKLETLYRRDSIFDGPAWVRHGGSGYLIFSDVPGNVIDRLNPDGSVTVLLKSVFTGRDPSQAYESLGLGGQMKFRMLGADGITLDRRGRVVYCAYGDGEVVRLETDGRRTVLASRFAGRRLNAPNDLAYKSDGSLYFTDSRAAAKRADGVGVSHEGLYLLRAGKVMLLSGSIDHPNGVAFSPDEKYLYVTNTRLENVLRFNVQPRGISNGKVFIDMSGDHEAGAPDGIKVDERGDVYSTGPGGVWIISPAGKHIATIRTPRKITNMAFGGRDFRTFYMTAFGALYRIRLKTAGGRLTTIAIPYGET